MKYSQFPSRMCAIAFIEQIRSMFPSASVLLIGERSGAFAVKWGA
jgi:hypothetical protein